MRHFGLLLAVVVVIGVVTAGSVFAAAGKGPGGRPPTGEITKIEGKALTVKVTREGAATEQTATVDDATEISKEEPAKLESLKVGDRVRITQGEKRLYGEIAKIDGKTLTLKGRGGEEQTVTVDDSTTILARVKAKFEDLKVGQQVMLFAQEGKAVRVTVIAASAKEGEGKGKEGKK